MKKCPVILVVGSFVLIGCSAGEDHAGRSGESIERHRTPLLVALPDSVVDRFTLGPLEVILGQTRLSDVTAELGGSIVEEGDAGSHMTSVCYITADSAQIVLGSSSLGGPSHTLTEATLIASGASKSSKACAAVPVDSRSVRFERGFRLGISLEDFRGALPEGVTHTSNVLRREWSGDYQPPGGSVRVDYFAGIEGMADESEIQRIHIWLAEST